MWAGLEEGDGEGEREESMIAMPIMPIMTDDRIQLTGPDGETAPYISTRLAAEQLHDYAHALRVVQASCQRYLARIQEEQRAFLARRGGGVEREQVDYRPRPNELVCIRMGHGRHAIYWVKESSLASRFVNKRDAQGQLARPGRPAGARNKKIGKAETTEK